MEFAWPNFAGSFGYSIAMKGSCTELFVILMTFKDVHKSDKTVAAVNVFKLDKNNMTWEETEDLKDTILYVNRSIKASCFVSPAIASSELGGYVHILLDNGRIIYSYHVKEKTIFLSSMPCLAGTNHISVWAMPGLEGDCLHLDYKQEKEDEIVVRSVEGNNEVECLKLLPLACTDYDRRLESDNADYKQENDEDVDIFVRSVKGDEDETHLLNLPLHVLEMVMKFSVGVEYLKFRSTCKRCHLAAPLIQWNNGKASKRLQDYSLLSPWVMVFDKHEGIIRFTDPLFGDKYFIQTPQELICDFQIMCSRYYHVCIHFVGGEPSCRIISLNVTLGEMFNSFTFYGRDLYALRDDGGLDVFEEIGREGHSWVRNVAQAPTSCGTSYPESFQVRCEQHLLRVIMSKFGESVEVFKLNDSTQEWVKINSLGKHTIYICGTSSLCIDAKTTQMENKIYFLRLPIVYYSLETCRFHTFDNTNIQDSFGDLSGIKQHLAPNGWIEPSWS